MTNVIVLLKRFKTNKPDMLSHVLESSVGRVYLYFENDCNLFKPVLELHFVYLVYLLLVKIKEKCIGIDL